MFKLSSHPLEISSLKKDFINPGAGALAAFEGIVRNENGSKKVTFLEYETYAQLAQTEADKILNEARLKFDILDCRCCHRTGKLSVGDLAVWVGVLAGHRDAAFQACRYIIDEIKTRLPIWKKEYYTNGDSGWINCQQQSPSLKSKKIQT